LTPPSRVTERAPAWLAGAAAATSTVSIAASQILLGAAVLSLLLAPRKLRWPPVTAPLAAFLLWTLVALAASPDPRGGLPQIKKFYVYLMLWAVTSGLRTLREVRWVAWGWIAGGALSAAWALVQGYRMYRANPVFFYYVYTNDARITGFMDHWMTFSGITMLALLAAGARALFERGVPRALYAAILLLAVGLLAGWQRALWAGTAAGAAWLLWSRKRVLVTLVPVTIALLLAANPFRLRDRALSLLWPQPGVLDSTAHRAALRAVGRQMIRAHPLVGVGPEQAKVRFYDYAPPEVPRPVPAEWSIGHLHNVYYHYAAERGLPALAALLWFLGRVLYDFVRARQRAGEGRWMLEAAIAATLGMMVAGWGEVNFGDSEVLAMYLSIVACGYVVAQEAQPSPA
jgi:O-antigen ligase